MTLTTFDPTEGPSDTELQAQAAALAQGEKLYQAEQEDRAARMEEAAREQQDAELIGGKFKSQDELLRAYKELEAKLGKKPSEEEEEPVEELPEAAEEAPEVEEVAPYAETFTKAMNEFEQVGDISEEALDALASMDSKELIKSYLKFYSKTQQERAAGFLEANAVADIQSVAGGPEGYQEMIGWAAQNMAAAEQSAFNAVTAGGDAVAIKFAVEALFGRYRAAVGHEAKLVGGNKPTSSGPKPYRSQAELARDIANPKYDKDPAFRQDVMERLARSQDLL